MKSQISSMVTHDILKLANFTADFKNINSEPWREFVDLGLILHFY